MSQSKFLRGTLLITFGTFVTKFLGMIYKFPLESLIGAEGGALYSYAYNIYQIFLSIGTIGLPLAVAKFVSKYNALGDYATSRRIFRTGLIVMSVSGLFFFALLFFGAPMFASLTLSGMTEQTFTVDELAFVMRLVSFALILVPAMSMIRGFFQGHQSMGPSTASIIIEQIARIAFVLGGAFLVLYVFKGTIVQAVGMTTFGAFVGAVASLGVLIAYWMRRKDGLDQMLRTQSVPQSNATTWALGRELIVYAVPFVFVGLAIPLYQLVDQFTFNRAMSMIGEGAISEASYAVFVNWTHSLIMIPVSLATAFSLTLVPTITDAYTRGDMEQVRAYISQTIQLTLFVTAPAAIGLSVLGTAVYNSLYTTNILGGPILTAYAPVGILFALFSVHMAILQGLNLQRVAMLSLVIGVVAKAVLNIPFIMLFETTGAVLATAVGYLLSILWSFSHIMRATNDGYVLMFKRVLQVSTAVLLMALPVWGVSALLSMWLDPLAGRMQSLGIMLPSIIVGVIVYLLVAKWFNLYEKILGKQMMERLLRRRRARA
ncbi:MAG: putative polysaccharide biosynthesis protein [Bacilli bacterium]